MESKEPLAKILVCKGEALVALGRGEEARESLVKAVELWDALEAAAGDGPIAGPGAPVTRSRRIPPPRWRRSP